jgi:hypothetical protein
MSLTFTTQIELCVCVCVRVCFSNEATQRLKTMGELMVPPSKVKFSTVHREREGWKHIPQETNPPPPRQSKDPAKQGSGNQSCNAVIENFQVNVSSSLR